MASPPFLFDEAAPLNSALVSTYPANERTMRDNINSWTDFEHGSESGRHKIPTGNDAARDAITDWEKGSLWMSSQLSPTVLQMNTGTKASPVWGPVGQGEQAFPVNTLMLFQQTAAPTFWVKETTHNNKALRLQTGTATTGGADSFTTVFGSGAHRATDGYTLLTADMPSHRHVVNATSALSVTISPAGAYHGQDNNTGQYHTSTNTTMAADALTLVGGGGSHAHNIDTIDLEFVDVIIAKMS